MLVRVLKRCYIDDRIREPGDVFDYAIGQPLGSVLELVREKVQAQPEPVAAETPWIGDDLGDKPQAGSSPVKLPPLSARDKARADKKANEAKE